MKRKIIIILIWIALVIIFFGFFHWQNSKKVSYQQTQTPEVTNSQLEDIFNHAKEDAKRTINSNAPVYSNSNAPDVIAAKKVLLSETKIGEDYFNKHFEFAYGSDEGRFDDFGDTVYFIYSIGDYSTFISVNPNRNSTYTRTSVKGLREIDNVISSKDALNIASRCLEGLPFDNRGSVSLNGDGLFLRIYTNDWELLINLETGECKRNPARHPIM